MQPAFCSGYAAEQSRHWKFRERTEKICATANAVSLGRAEGYSPEKRGEDRCGPQVSIHCDRDKTAHVREKGLTRQLNERVVLLVLAESHAGVVYTMCAGTDQFWAGWSTKRPIFW